MKIKFSLTRIDCISREEILERI